jgi:Na+-transporting NADH:ubiquinone oxidoreductase subunit NqrD
VKRLCATVLIFEAIVMGLSIPVAVHIDHLAPQAAGLTSGTAAAAAVLLAAVARRLLTVTLTGGTLLQVFVIASGAIVPAMFFLGGIFAALWAVGIWLGYRFEHAAGH